MCYTNNLKNIMFSYIIMHNKIFEDGGNDASDRADESNFAELNMYNI